MGKNAMHAAANLNVHQCVVWWGERANSVAAVGGRHSQAVQYSCSVSRQPYAHTVATQLLCAAPMESPPCKYLLRRGGLVFAHAINRLLRIVKHDKASKSNNTSKVRTIYGQAPILQVQCKSQYYNYAGLIWVNCKRIGLR